MLNINCFVAMAFGRQDTDNIYTYCIEKTIKSLGFTPIRVDKKNHNDRIDQRILLEIEGSDVMISDLTYARPSVYYEAGYGERILGKKVIYTCRHDHIKNKEDNIRIHFDLQNANIIEWDESEKEIFQERLRERLELVTREIRRKKERDSELAKAASDFSLLPSSEQNKSIFYHISEKIQVNKFSKNDDKYKTSFYKKSQANIYFISLQSCGNWLQSSLKRVYRFRYDWDFFYKEKNKKMIIEDINIVKIPQSIRFIYIIPSIKLIPRSRVDAVFSSCRKTENRIQYYQVLGLPRKKSDKFIPIPTSYEFIFMDGLKSTNHVDDWFQNHFETVLNNKDCINYPIA